MARRGTVQSFDTIALLLALSLTGIGIVMLYSSSTDTATNLTGDHMFFLKRQLVRIVIGGTLMFYCANFDYHRLQGLANKLLLGAVLLLAITLGYHHLSGSNVVARWLPLGLVSVQPSDMARLALIIYLAAYLDRKGLQLTNFSHDFLPPMLVTVVIMGLIVFAPDFSTAALTGAIAVTLFYLGGA
ncbi:MAG: FtsW/RodA/SpoVE family cell cycle protein, partial [Candidatus Marinimicrobia bacterium]|nr:FtsW/RodA/SpoVE family cell cycle protein [Candidatus Neomarinimicrobiota bacterium]